MNNYIIMKLACIRFVIIFLLIQTLILVNAQNQNMVIKEDTDISDKNINNLYVELLGQGFKYSINYERIFMQKKKPYTFRGGLSYFLHGYFMNTGSWYNPNSAHCIVIPFSFSVLKGKQPNYLELGMGVTSSNIFQIGSGPNINVLGNFIVGYRRQKEKGFMFKIIYSPFIYLFSNDVTLKREDYVFGIIGLPIWFGVSTGYSF